MHRKSVTTKAIMPTPMQSICRTKYNKNFNSNSDENVEFMNIDLFCNKLNLQLLANDFIICTKRDMCWKQKMKSINPRKLKQLERKKYMTSKLAKNVQKHQFLFLALRANLFLIFKLFLLISILLYWRYNSFRSLPSFKKKEGV